VRPGTTRPAADAQKASAGPKVEPGEKPVELIDREPAVLADVLTEGRAANLAVRIRGEGPVVRTVVIDHIGPLSHAPSLRRGQRDSWGAIVGFHPLRDYTEPRRCDADGRDQDAFGAAQVDVSAVGEVGDPLPTSRLIQAASRSRVHSTTVRLHQRQPDMDFLRERKAAVLSNRPD